MRVREAEYSQVRVMLVGHDYSEDGKGNFLWHDREVSTKEGHEVARELGCDFIKASADHGVNLEKTSYDAARAVRLQRASDMPVISELARSI